MKTKRVILMGGLGNQLFQYAFAMHLSGHQNTTILLDQNLGTIRRNRMNQPELDGFGLSNRVGINDAKSSTILVKRIVGLLIRSHLKPNSIGILAFNRIISLFAKIILSIHFKTNIKLYVATDAGMNTNQIKDKNLFIGYFQSYRYSNSSDEYSELKKIAIRNLGVGYSYLESKARDEMPLVVHVRLTDYRVEEKFGIPSLEYYRIAIERQWETRRYRKIWLFSDDPEASLEFVPENYREFISNLDVKELDSSQTLNAMRLGHGYVLANSTFSWWSAYLSHTTEPIIMYPIPWFKGMPDPNDMFPEVWVPIPR